MAPTRDSFIQACAAEVDYTESPAGSNKQKFAKVAGHPNGFAWCQTFLNAMAVDEKLQLPRGMAASAYTPTCVNLWKAERRWHTTPQIGDFAYFQFDDDPQVDHVGLVESFDDTTVTCIEGNTSKDGRGSQSNGGGVFRRTRKRSLVRGYGRPTYSVAELPAPVVIVKDGSIEAQLIDLYPMLFKREVRVVNADPKKDVYAAANPADVGFGVAIYGAVHNYVGSNRYETLVMALATEKVTA